MFIPGNRYTKSDLYDLLAVPANKQKGSWNTGYLKYENQIFIFANIGVAGRTGHDYDNHWYEGDLVWFGKTQSRLSQPSIKIMLQPQTTVHIFTRTVDRDPFTYQGLGRAKTVRDTTPVRIIWQIFKNLPVIKNEAPEPVLTRNIKQANNDDINERITKSLKKRKAQGKFNENLFTIYSGKCCITGCDVQAVLDACHIIPHAESGNNNTTNGLLLRSDIHDLFDAHLLGIHPITLKIHIKKQLQNTDYKYLQGKTLMPPIICENVNKEALKKRWELFKKGDKTKWDSVS